MIKSLVYIEFAKASA